MYITLFSTSIPVYFLGHTHRKSLLEGSWWWSKERHLHTTRGIWRSHLEWGLEPAPLGWRRCLCYKGQRNNRNNTAQCQCRHPTHHSEANRKLRNVSRERQTFQMFRFVEPVEKHYLFSWRKCNWLSHEWIVCKVIYVTNTHLANKSISLISR